MKPGRWTYSQFLLNCLWRDWCWLWQFIHQTELCLAVSISLVMTTQNSSCCWGWSPSLMKISIFSQRDVGTISQWCLPVGSLFHSSTAFVLYKSDFIFDCRVKFHSPWLMQGCSYQLCLSRVCAALGPGLRIQKEVALGLSQWLCRKLMVFRIFSCWI